MKRNKRKGGRNGRSEDLPQSVSDFAEEGKRPSILEQDVSQLTKDLKVLHKYSIAEDISEDDMKSIDQKLKALAHSLNKCAEWEKKLSPHTDRDEQGTGQSELDKERPVSPQVESDLQNLRQSLSLVQQTVSDRSRSPFSQQLSGSGDELASTSESEARSGSSEQSVEQENETGSESSQEQNEKGEGSEASKMLEETLSGHRSDSVDIETTLKSIDQMLESSPSYSPSRSGTGDGSDDGNSEVKECGGADGISAVASETTERLEAALNTVEQERDEAVAKLKEAQLKLEDLQARLSQKGRECDELRIENEELKGKGKGKERQPQSPRSAEENTAPLTKRVSFSMERKNTAEESQRARKRWRKLRIVLESVDAFKNAKLLRMVYGEDMQSDIDSHDVSAKKENVKPPSLMRRLSQDLGLVQKKKDRQPNEIWRKASTLIWRPKGRSDSVVSVDSATNESEDVVDSPSGHQKMFRQAVRKASTVRSFSKGKRRLSVVDSHIKPSKERTLPVILPYSAFSQAWILVMLIVTIFNCIILPVRFGFPSAAPDDEANVLWWGVFDIAFDLLLVADVSVNLMTSHMHENEYVTDHYDIFKHNLKHGLVWDLMALFPTYMALSCLTAMTGGLSPPSSISQDRIMLCLRLPRLLSIFRVNLSNCKPLHAVFQPIAIRLIGLTTVLFLISHIVGCMWYFISEWEGFPATGWGPSEVTRSSGFLSQYIRSLFWAFTTMTGVGSDVVPQTDKEYVFTLIVVILGIFVYASIIGNVGSLLSQLDSKSTRFQEKMESINQFLRETKLPKELCQQIRDYYEYTHTRDVFVSGPQMFEALPEHLQTNIAVVMNRELIQKVPIFSTAEPSLLNDLVPLLRPQVAIPGSLIIQRDDLGREMYFIRKGKVDVLSPNDDESVLATLSDGSFFGEVALLGSEGARRMCSVRTVTYCDFYMLKKDDFESVIKNYPSYRSHLVKVSKKRAKSTIQLQG